VRSTWVGDYRFGHERIEVRRNTLFRWRFLGAARHDVTLANGPEGLASASVTRGTYSFRFRRRGTYNLYCSLHPGRMSQQLKVE
jgi:plastocyanin